MTTAEDVRLTPALIKDIAERAEKATPGPWQSRHEFDWDGMCEIIGAIDGPDDGRFHYTVVCDINEAPDEWEANRQFIIHARTDIPALLAHITALEKERDEARSRANKFRQIIIDARNKRGKWGEQARWELPNLEPRTPVSENPPEPAPEALTPPQET